MKKALIILLIAQSLNGYAQVSETTDKEAVKNVVNQFFNSLEKQDTVLFKKNLFPEGQVWILNNTKEPAKHAMRVFKDDIKMFSPEVQFLETALDFEIKIHKGLAMAWVPYEFRRNGSFSHCGVDIFTLIKVKGTWKITTISYTIDSHGCDELKNTE